MWWCLSGFLAKAHLSLVTSVSHLSVNDKGDNEIIPGDVQKSPGICLNAGKNPGKPQLRDSLMKIL